MKLTRLSLLALAAALCSAVTSRGDVLAQYTFDTAVDKATTTDAHATVSPLTFGSAVNVPKGVDKAFYKSLPMLPLSRKEENTAQTYVEFTVTAASGSKLKLRSFSFDAAKGGASDPRTYEVHTSVGGLTISTDVDHAGKALASGTLTAQRPTAGNDGEMQTITVDLSDAAYSKLDTLTIRVYFNTPDASQNIDFDNITLNGSAGAE